MRTEIDPNTEEFPQLFSVKVEIPARITKEVGVEIGKDIDITDAGLEIATKG